MPGPPIRSPNEMDKRKKPRQSRAKRALPSGSIKHALCTEYDVSAGIGWHRDKRHFDQVFGLSLASACKFRFRRRADNKWERFTLNAQPRSLYVMIGASRYLGAQHPAGRDPALFDHLPYHGPSPSIGFDLKSRIAAVSCRS
jgi:alkylated DNA repair dioxygenase AlkB